VHFQREPLSQAEKDFDAKKKFTVLDYHISEDFMTGNNCVNFSIHSLGFPPCFFIIISLKETHFFFSFAEVTVVAS
jgi:hypothetical protein